MQVIGGIVQWNIQALVTLISSLFDRLLIFNITSILLTSKQDLLFFSVQLFVKPLMFKHHIHIFLYAALFRPQHNTNFHSKLYHNLYSIKKKKKIVSYFLHSFCVFLFLLVILNKVKFIIKLVAFLCIIHINLIENTYDRRRIIMHCRTLISQFLFILNKP